MEATARRGGGRRSMFARRRRIVGVVDCLFGEPVASFRWVCLIAIITSHACKCIQRQLPPRS
eukprot:2895156-Prymnesium_polylepis.1